MTQGRIKHYIASNALIPMCLIFMVIGFQFHLLMKIETPRIEPRYRRKSSTLSIFPTSFTQTILFHHHKQTMTDGRSTLKFHFPTGKQFQKRTPKIAETCILTEHYQLSGAIIYYFATSSKAIDIQQQTYHSRASKLPGWNIFLKQYDWVLPLKHHMLCISYHKSYKLYPPLSNENWPTT